MAATAYREEEPTAIDETAKLTITQLLEADNVCDLLPDNEVMRIGQTCLREFENDLESRGDYEKDYQRYLDIAMQVRKPKSFPWQGASNLKLPILTTAAIQFQARAYPAIIEGMNLVKGRVLGDDSGIPEMGPDGQPLMQPPASPDAQPEPVWQVPPGAKRDRADRIGDHMSWQLLFDMPDWEEATDKLLLQLPIVADVFRKTYHDPIEQKNVSKTISGIDFVINYWATSLEDTPRYTERFRRYPHEVEERFRTEIWRRVDLPVSTSDHDQSDTAPIEFLEQHCRIDLDKDGYPEPYIVTLVRESGNVVRITPCFDADDVTINKRDNTVVKIARTVYYTQYAFMPSPDGSFYSMGFGKLLDDITAAIDTNANQMIDAGALQNAQGGFVGSGVNMKSGDIRFRLGEWKRMDVTGGTLRENIVPLNLPGPSQVLFNLLELLLGMAKEITSVQDVLTGQTQGANESPTTLLARIEQASKVLNGITKRVHRAAGKEFKNLRRLNRDHLDETVYFALTDKPGKVGRADYQDKDIDVAPVSDPSMATDAQKAVKAQVLLTQQGNPKVNQDEVLRRFFEATGQRDIKALLDVPAPGPPPELLLEMQKQANERDKTKAAIRKDNAAAAASLMAAAASAFAMNMLNDVAALAAAATRLGTDAADMEDSGEPIDRPGSDGGMGEPSGDAGLPAVPEGLPGEAGGGMGGGQPDVTAAAGPGGLDGANGGVGL